MSKFLKVYHSERHIAMNPPQNISTNPKHTYPTVMSTFGSSSVSPLSCRLACCLGCLDILNELKCLPLTVILTLGKT